MRVLIVGAGIIGTIYGWAISEAGHDVTHFVRTGKAAGLNNGIFMDVLDNRKEHKKQFVGIYHIKVTEELNSSDVFELIIVPTKPYQLIKALEQIVPKLGNTDYLLLTQNWYGTEKIDDILVQSQYLFGDAKAGGTYINGTLVSTIFPSIDIGQINHRKDNCLTKAKTLFSSIDIKPIIQENILHYIWVQYAINAGLWPPLVRSGDLATLIRDRKNSNLCLFAVKECLNVVARRNVDLSKYSEAKLFSNTSFVARIIVSFILRITFRFNKSIQRSSAHGLADPKEIKTAFYDLLNTGLELGVNMPIMNSFKQDINLFSGT